MQMRPRDLIDQAVQDADGVELGRVADVLTDLDTGEARWVAVTSGSGHGRLAPLAGAHMEYQHLVLAVRRAQVETGPRASEDSALSPERERELQAAYALDAGEETAGAQAVGYDDEGVRMHGSVTTGTSEQGQDADRPAVQVDPDSSDQSASWTRRP